LTTNQRESPAASMIRSRIVPILFCIASVVTCFAYAWTRGQLPDWWRNHGGGIPYVVFWICLWHVLLPQRKYIPAICIGCVLFTCLLEFVQATSLPQPLDDFRRTRFGAAWLGYGFDAHDIPPYFLGGIVGWFLLIGSAKAETQSNHCEGTHNSRQDPAK